MSYRADKQVIDTHTHTDRHTDRGDGNTRRPKLASGKNQNTTLIIGGDFNTGYIDWESNEILPGCPNIAVHEKLVSILADHHLHQMQRLPTRLDRILDLFCVNKPGLLRYTTTIPGISDHEIIVADMDLKPQYSKKKPHKVYVYSKADWESIRRDINNFTEQYIQEHPSRSVNENWNIFKGKLHETIDRYIPSRTTSSRNHLPWINSSIRRMTRKKQRLYNLARRTKKTKHWERFNQLKRETRRALRRAHIDYINNIFRESLEKHDSKTFWRYVKSQRQENVGIAPLKRGGTLHSDSTTKAEILSEQFQSVFTPDTEDAIPQLEGTPYPTISRLHISQPGVTKLLLNLKVRKASGPDNIPARILKELAHEISPGLTAVFNQSLHTGELPSDWKTALVTPIFKKGNKHLPENYRPVSLTSISCKVMEHIVCHHVLEHLDQHRILSSFQHGFRAMRSCETQLLTTIHDFMTNYDNKHQIDIAILDFAKAFDTVPHDKLLYKIQHYGIDGHIHSWIQSFLKGRSQSVVVEGDRSSAAPVTSGVPQGTVLGPLLFLLHINDLPGNVQSQVRLFADDCLLNWVIDTAADQHLLQQDLQALEQWGLRWAMRFNASKKRDHESLSLISTHQQHLHVPTRRSPPSGSGQSEISGCQHIQQLVLVPIYSQHHCQSELKGGIPMAQSQALPQGITRAGIYRPSPLSTWVRLCRLGSPLTEGQHHSSRSNEEQQDSPQGTQAGEAVSPRRWKTLAGNHWNTAVVTSDWPYWARSLVGRQQSQQMIYSPRQIPEHERNTPTSSGILPAKTTAFKNSFFPRTIPEWNALSREAMTSAISLNAAITSDPAQSSQGAAAVRM